MGYRINIDVYDNVPNKIGSLSLCRYFKVIKNSLLDNKIPFYNQYQFLVEVLPKNLELINSKNIFKITIRNNEDNFIIFIRAKEIQHIKDTNESVVYNILGLGLNIDRFMNEELLCRITDYDRFFNIFGYQKAAFTVSNFNLMREAMFKLIDIVYGPYNIDANFNDKFINSTSLTHQNLPIMNNIDTLKYYFKKFNPVLDYTFFAIDDFIPLKANSNKTGSVILNSYSNINSFRKDLISSLTFFGFNNTKTLTEINKNEIYKFAYGDYLIYDVDHPKTQIGDFFSMPRAFGKTIKQDNLRSIYTVDFEYPINKIDMNVIRDNYKKLLNQDLLTYVFTFNNVSKEFLEINKIFKIEENSFYVYGNEFEFVPLSGKSIKTDFKINGSIKTLKLK